MRSDPTAGDTTEPGVGSGQVRSWRDDCPVVDSRRMLRLHRYTDPEKVRPIIRETAEQVADLVADVLNIDGRYLRLPIAACGDGLLRLDDGTEFACPAFDRLLGGCTEVIAFVLTLGPDLDARVIKMIDDFEPLEALFSETASWLTVEAATRHLGSFLRGELRRENLTIEHRMGPGYNYRADGNGSAERVEWRLEEQGKLFALFGDVELPVELTASSVMKPKMSRSGIFGIAPRRD